MKQRWKPKDMEKYWYITIGYFGPMIAQTRYCFDTWEKKLYKDRNMFRTKKEAKQKLERIKKVLQNDN